MPVPQSSHLSSYSYDADSQTLTIQFHNGAIYQYTNVPATEYDNFKQSGGTGTYFVHKIKHQYPMTKIFDPRFSR
jgi:hypothetical protein